MSKLQVHQLACGKQCNHVIVELNYFFEIVFYCIGYRYCLCNTEKFQKLNKKKEKIKKKMLRKISSTILKYGSLQRLSFIFSFFYHLETYFMVLYWDQILKAIWWKKIKMFQLFLWKVRFVYCFSLFPDQPSCQIGFYTLRWKW